MESVACPSCDRIVTLPLEILAEAARCPRCSSHFVPLEELPRSDFADSDVDFDTYVFRSPKFYAVGYLSEDDQFVAVRGSRFFYGNVKPHSQAFAMLRTKLIVEGILAMDPEGRHFTLVEDYFFDDQDIAASVVAGKKMNGTPAWELLEEAEEGIDEDELDEDTPWEAVNRKEEYYEGTHFLDFSREYLRSLIVTVLEKRPNNSVKEDELVKEILSHINVLTSKSPRRQFNAQILTEVQWLARRKVVSRYRVKNDRVRLTEFYRDQLSLIAGRGEFDPKRAVTPSMSPKAHSASSSRENGTQCSEDTVESLRAEIARLRKAISLLMSDGKA